MQDLKNYSPAKDLLKNRVVLVTGAGQGIGRAAALAYAMHGATVILHGRNIKKLEGVYDEIEAVGGAQPAIFPLDLEKAEDKDFLALAYGIKQQLGRLDGILHNAALLFNLTPLESQTHGPMAVTAACQPYCPVRPDSSLSCSAKGVAGCARYNDFGFAWPRACGILGRFRGSQSGSGGAGQDSGTGMGNTPEFTHQCDYSRTYPHSTTYPDTSWRDQV